MKFHGRGWLEVFREPCLHFHPCSGLSRTVTRERPRGEQTLKMRAGYDVASTTCRKCLWCLLLSILLFRQSVLTKHVTISRGKRRRDFKVGVGNVLIACKEQPPPHWIVSMVTVST